MRRKLWEVKELTSEAKGLGKKYNISPFLAQIFLNRKIKDADFSSFLKPELSQLYSPYMLPDMDKAVERITKAAKAKERILLVGDYDVDGITSLAIFYEFIKEFPDTFSFYIPHRVNDGYGFGMEAIIKAKKENRSLIICFDCGTNSFSQIELARSEGIDVIVVDHHHSRNNLSNAVAFINPKREDSTYPFFDLTSAALSFKLLQGLKNLPCWEVLDLVALSLICDVAPLKGENRILLKASLKVLKESPRPAIKALCQASSLKQQNLDTFHIGYILGPRINASGRVAHAQDSLEIFLTDDEREACDIAAKLGDYNQLRKGIGADVLKQAERIVERDFIESSAIIVSGENWHRGVLGIVASRLADKYYRPSFVISFEGDIGRGSARSIHSVHLMKALDKCANLLTTYGGHKKAAGIQISKQELGTFTERINSFIKEDSAPQDFIPVLSVDLKMKFADIDVNFIEEIEILKPFGEENPAPLFASYNISKKTPPKKISSGYSLWLSDDDKTYEGIIYDKDVLEIINYGDNFDLVYSLGKNVYHNIPRLIIRDCKLFGGRS
ncbi:MAG: single-stranded-DNA-specific exonuclease RecJ [Candidatus Omnitrophota bacterium]|nr:single-stranded-DNA-specific exonuclease RecJ [Candidatus Omnitrophota bacterium]